MARLKQWFQAASALLVAGTVVSVGVALREANKTFPDQYSCQELRPLLRKVRHMDTVDWYVAIKDRYPVTTATGSWIVGDCGSDGGDPLVEMVGGKCRLHVEGCRGSVDYTYNLRTISVGGVLWDFAHMTGPVYFARAWKHVADTDANMHYFGGWAELKSKCVAKLGAAQCRNLLPSLVSCWRLSDGNYCRDGLLYGAGEGGTNPCAPDDSSDPYPCTSPSGPEWAEAVAGVGAPPIDTTIEIGD